MLRPSLPLLLLSVHHRPEQSEPERCRMRYCPQRRTRSTSIPGRYCLKSSTNVVCVSILCGRDKHNLNLKSVRRRICQ